MKKVFVLMLLVVCFILLAHSYLLYTTVISVEIFDPDSKEYVLHFGMVVEPIETIWLLDTWIGAACCVVGLIVSFLIVDATKWIFLTAYVAMSIVFYLVTFM